MAIKTNLLKLMKIRICDIVTNGFECPNNSPFVQGTSELSKNKFYGIEPRCAQQTELSEVQKHFTVHTRAKAKSKL